MTAATLLFTAFFVKHFICDFLLQMPYQYLNKGKYGHGGGLLHAAIHAVGTWVVFAAVIQPDISRQMLFLAFLDGVAHYHIDWAKTNISARFNLSPTTHEQYWWLLGFDQLLHYLTYAFIVWKLS